MDYLCTYTTPDHSFSCNAPATVVPVGAMDDEDWNGGAACWTHVGHLREASR